MLDTFQACFYGVARSRNNVLSVFNNVFADIGPGNAGHTNAGHTNAGHTALCIGCFRLIK